MVCVPVRPLGGKKCWLGMRRRKKDYLEDRRYCNAGVGWSCVSDLIDLDVANAKEALSELGQVEEKAEQTGLPNVRTIGKDIDQLEDRRSLDSSLKNVWFAYLASHQNRRRAHSLIRHPAASWKSSPRPSELDPLACCLSPSCHQKGFRAHLSTCSRILSMI